MVLVFIAQVLLASAPLVLSAVGGVISERSGVATIGLEAYLLVGAFAAAVTALASGSTSLALVSAVTAGALFGALFAWCTLGLRANSIVAGVAINLFAAAATRTALKVLYGSASNSPPLSVHTLVAQSHTVHSGAGFLPTQLSAGLSALEDALGSPVVLLAPAVVFSLHLILSRSVFGLRLTAAGEHPEAARSQGVEVTHTRALALTIGGAVAALGGAQLSLHQGEFVAFMSNGRGFLALAAVILGRWRPIGAALWALAIGALSALEATLAGRVNLPPALLQALPYALTLAAVTGRWGRTRAPAALE